MRRSFFLFMLITCFMNMHAMQEVNPTSESENTHEIHSESSDPENPPQYAEIEIISADHPPATDSSHAHSAPRNRNRCIKWVAIGLAMTNIILTGTTWLLTAQEDDKARGLVALATFFTSGGAAVASAAYCHEAYWHDLQYGT